MRYAVIGTGGIGGVLAACLTRAGADVTPIARDPAAREALAQGGYRVTDLDGKAWSVPVSRPPAATLPEAGGAFDVVIVTTQAPALEDALVSATPALSAGTIVMVCQNGLPEARAAATLPGARILGCVVGWGASMTAPGVFRRTSRGGLQLGQLAGIGAEVPRAELERLRDGLRGAGPADLATNFAGVRWSKLALNCVTSTLGALGGVALGPLLYDRTIRRLALEIFTEVRAVAEAEGVTMAPVGGTLDIRTLTLVDAERRARYGKLSLVGKHALMLAVGVKFRRMRSSMLYALERGRPPEIGFLNGEVVRRGEAAGVPTPVSRALVERVREIEAGEHVPSMHALRALARQLAN